MIEVALLWVSLWSFIGDSYLRPSMNYIHPQSTGFILGWLRGAMSSLDPFKINSRIDIFSDNINSLNLGHQPNKEWLMVRISQDIFSLGFSSKFEIGKFPYQYILPFYGRFFPFSHLIYSSSDDIGLWSSSLILGWVIFKFIFISTLALKWTFKVMKSQFKALDHPPASLFTYSFRFLFSLSWQMRISFFFFLIA